MRILLAVALSLFLGGPAVAQSCLPTPLEQTDTLYRVSFGGLPYTINYNRLQETGNNARAEELREILQWKSDSFGVQPLAVLVQVGDPDGINDPEQENYYHSDNRGRRASPAESTHITSRCALAVVEWNPVRGDFVIGWRSPF